MSLSLPDVEFELIALDAVKRTLIAAQCRAARGLLNWSQDALAEASKVGISTVGDFERERRTPCDHLLRDMRSALESAGIEFIADPARLFPNRLFCVHVTDILAAYF
jgi:transcriptional regulator with XRE-family HTH domain